MEAETSAYYPPRAKGLGRLRHPFWCIADKIPSLPKSTGTIAFALFAPGLALRSTEYQKYSWAAFGAYLFFWVTYFVTLGLPLATLSFSALMIIHGASLACVLRRVIPGTTRRTRVLEAIAILCWLVAFYSQTMSLVENCVQPVRYREKVYVAYQWGVPKFRRNEWMVYRVASVGEHGYRINEALSVGKIWAVPGDRVEITLEELRVNGISHPRIPDMPESAELVVPESCYFVWPDFVIQGGEVQRRMTVAEMRARLGLVRDEEVQGKIPQHWFFRTQF